MHRHHAEEAKAGKKRTFAEELVFALSDDEESDEGPGEPEPKMRLRGQEPPQRLQAWYQAREDFQPPHCLAAQSCPGNAAGGALPSLAVRSPSCLMNILVACARRGMRPLVGVHICLIFVVAAPWTAPRLPCTRVRHLNGCG